MRSTTPDPSALAPGDPLWGWRHSAQSLDLSKLLWHTGSWQCMRLYLNRKCFVSLCKYVLILQALTGSEMAWKTLDTQTHTSMFMITYKSTSCNCLGSLAQGWNKQVVELVQQALQFQTEPDDRKAAKSCLLPPFSSTLKPTCSPGGNVHRDRWSRSCKVL